MKDYEAQKYMGKKVKLILSNNFHYTGEILKVSGDDLTLEDKNKHIVTIRLSSIIIFQEVKDEN